MPVLASNEEIASLRKPKQIYTQAYLDDPIQFASGDGFIPETLVQQVQDFPVIKRDFAQFIDCDLGASGSQFYPVQMYINRLDRVDYVRQIDRTIKQLLPASR